MMNYSDAKAEFISALAAAANAHESDEFASIAEGYEKLDGGLPRDSGDEFNKLFVALSFWDGWIDARNHDWQYYDPIRKEDWPELARKIVLDLEADQEIHDQIVLKRFGLQEKPQGVVKAVIEALFRKR